MKSADSSQGTQCKLGTKSKTICATEFSHRRAGVWRFKPYQTVELYLRPIITVRGKVGRLLIHETFIVWEEKGALYETTLHQAALLPTYNKDPFSEGCSISDSFNGACLSIFSFIFQCYENLIRRVDRHLDLEELRQDSDPQASELVLIARFRMRTRDEELRYIALLCLQGYVCLTVAERYSDAELRQFVLKSFTWFCRDGTNHIPDTCAWDIFPPAIQPMNHGAEDDSSGTKRVW
ncbi:hypothetical protein FVEG_17108 [Fusarium verticillioides 7600]|uniref:Uncharacterized protein n=1 Tax=Gibberella moniliformis (strain M3125 / FGSC 7600) TaxID=334819 RepID=W7MZW2_GIBM7|nr:hypothetical protein FVEG_17108 [Fusarium verticillioides 7600]EWG53380.1 hypothetical protein FVEG_17108 [Fusarium verticillioides 7600]